MADAPSQYLTLPQAAALLPPRNGRRVSTPTIWRWASKGVRGVRLRTLRFGRAIVTTAADLERFGRELAEATSTTDADARPQSDSGEGQASNGSS